MELEGMFSSSKWSIIQLLAEQELSPLQISEILNTSVANVSQQLRLLELLGIVSARKIPNREKGKPRTLYALSNDYVYVISALKNFAKKNLIKATPMHSAVARILCIKDSQLHYPLMKLFWMVEPQLANIQAMFYDSNTSTFHIIGSSLKLKLQNSYTFVYDGTKHTINVRLEPELRLERLKQGMYLVYDPKHMLKEEVVGE
ncbi:hypothetical protein DRJ48_03090 [Candidatus Woesearchaeota archaeon]|nr:MAG: hypothetical protein DRJ48_03090 [Candidatus Woesearchaeota archaeon]